jgi:hypothetical protein
MGTSHYDRILKHREIQSKTKLPLYFIKHNILKTFKEIIVGLTAFLTSALNENK